MLTRFEKAKAMKETCILDNDIERRKDEAEIDRRMMKLGRTSESLGWLSERDKNNCAQGQ